MLAGAGVIALIVFNLRHSPEWRHFDWHELLATAVTAEPGLLFIALITVFVSHLVRAVRWQLLMMPVKHGSLRILFKGQILGFSSIYMIGRTGEVVRPAYIARKEEVSMSSMMAVWLLERILDEICLVLLFSLALMALPIEMTTRRGSAVLVTLRHAGDMLLVLAIIIVALVVVFRWKTEFCASMVVKALVFFPERFRHGARRFLNSFSDGLRAVQGPRGLFGAIVLTGLLWGVNGSTFWLVLHSLRGTLGGLPWLAAALVMFCASLGLVVQFPGIGGGYQVAIILALTEVFSIQAAVATGAAILIWLLISLPIMAVGLGILVHEGITLRKLEALAEQGEAAVESGG